MRKLLAGIVGGALIALAAIVPAMADPVVVQISGNTSAGENQPGWMFNRDVTTQTPFEFTTDEASIGAGSVYVLPIGANASDKFIAELFMLSPLADVELISYDFKLGAVSDPGDHVHFYLNVYANFSVSPADKFYDCRYNILPASGSAVDFTTVTFDPTSSYSVTTRGGAAASPFPCPASPADMGPGAVIRAIAINVGDTSTSDEGVNGYIDNVVVAQTTGTVIYDLDPEPPQPQTAADCKNGGWADYGFSNQGRCIQFVNTGKDSR